MTTKGSPLAFSKYDNLYDAQLVGPHEGDNQLLMLQIHLFFTI